MSNPTREQALAHFGVKGMKWGVRRKSTSGGGSPSSANSSPTPSSTSSRTTVLKRGLAPAGKAALKTGARVGLFSVLAAVGIPPAVAGIALAAQSAIHPELRTVGKEVAKQLMSELGLKKMSDIDIAASNAKINAVEMQLDLEKKTGRQFH